MVETLESEIALMKKDIETLSKDIRELNEKMDKLMVKLLDPDMGLVVRVNKNTDRLDEKDKFIAESIKDINDFREMKKWKANVTTALWGLYTAVLAWLAKTLFW
jgi:predicted  nucleic acid-binding Zn-ribbon protein